MNEDQQAGERVSERTCRAAGRPAEGAASLWLDTQSSLWRRKHTQLLQINHKSKLVKH